MMKILQRYVLLSFLSSFLLAFLVLTFVMSVGLLVKATQLVVDDIPVKIVARFLLIGIPESFSFTIPLAILVSSLLVFGRLSSDGEIGAMKACGVNLWSIMLPLIVFGLAMTAFGVYVNNWITPASHLMRRSLRADVKSSGLLLLEPGTEQNLLGKTFWFESKEGDILHNVHIREVSTNGTPRTIRAADARVTQEGDDMVLDLYRVRVDPFNENFPGAATADRLTHVIEGAMKASKYNPKAEDYSLAELRGAISEARDKVQSQREWVDDMAATAANATAARAFETNAAPVVWTGAESSDWNAPGNWDSGAVPDGAPRVAVESAEAVTAETGFSIPTALELLNGTAVSTAGEIRFGGNGASSCPIYGGSVTGATVAALSPGAKLTLSDCALTISAPLPDTAQDLEGTDLEGTDSVETNSAPPFFALDSGSYLNFVDGTNRAASFTFPAGIVADPFELFSTPSTNAPYIRYNDSPIDKAAFRRSFRKAENDDGTMTVSMRGDGSAQDRLDALTTELKLFQKELRMYNFELHRRFAMASAAICFLLLGMPLGIRARRRESTIGIAIALGIALLYYLFVVAGDQFVKNVGGPVHMIVWVPAAVCLVVSTWLTSRNS